MLNSLLLVPIAVLLDGLLGEPSKFHPLIGFGFYANKLEAKLNGGKSRFISRFHKGWLAWGLAIIPITLFVYWLSHIGNELWQFIVGAIFGWLAIGWKSLSEHGLAVMNALNSNNMGDAQIKTSYLVSRNTSSLNETDLSRATIESLLENGSDAIFAPLFWLAILGAPGVVFYRLCNTLDAMWGYRNDRFEQFGKFTARMDDVLNYIPARLTALLYTLCGDTKTAWRAWQTQGKTWYSPNAGVVMASGAGALKLVLGGTATYHGKPKQRPKLGSNNKPRAQDIKHAVNLIDRSVYCFIGVIVVPLLLGGIWLASLTR